MPEFVVREGEMRGDTAMVSDFPDIFMLVRLSVPSFWGEKTEEEVNEVSMETGKLLRERERERERLPLR